MKIPQLRKDSFLSSFINGFFLCIIQGSNICRCSWFYRSSFSPSSDELLLLRFFCANLTRICKTWETAILWFWKDIFYFNLGSTWENIIYNVPNVIYQHSVEIYLVFIICDIDTGLSHRLEIACPRSESPYAE